MAGIARIALVARITLAGCVVMPSLLWAHPHLSITDARRMLDEAQAELSQLRERHGGPPALTHEDAKTVAGLACACGGMLFFAGDTPTALTICNEVAARFPDFPDTYSMRRAVHLAQGNGALADEDARRYLQLGAGTPTLALQLISREVSDDDPDQALASRRLQLALAESAIKRWPDEASLWSERLRLLLQIDDPAASDVLADIFAKGTEERRRIALETFEQYRPEQDVRAWLVAQDLSWLDVPPPEQVSSRVDLAAIFYQLGAKILPSVGLSRPCPLCNGRRAGLPKGKCLPSFYSQIFRRIGRAVMPCLASGNRP